MKIIKIGCNANNDIVIKNDSSVSSHHCQIVQHDNGTFSITDLGSANGTFVNGSRIKGEIKINPHDTVRIGNTTLPWQSYFAKHDKKSRKWPWQLLGILLLLALVALVLYFALKEDGKDEWVFPEVTITFDNDNPEGSLLHYDTDTLYIPSGETFEDAFLRKNPNYEQLKEEYNLGGAKLISEMSADCQGLNQSESYYETKIPIYSLPQLKLKPTINIDNNGNTSPEDPHDIVYLIYTKKILIPVDPVCKSNWGNGKGTFVIDIPIIICDGNTDVDIDDYDDAEEEPSDSDDNDENEKQDADNPEQIGDDDIVVTVSKGQMVEVDGNGVQNIVVVHNARAVLKTRCINHMEIYLDCAARRRGSPSGHTVRFTPFRLDASSKTFANQDAVWKHIETQKKFPVTFFVRPKLDRSQFDNKLEKKALIIYDHGHAFVRIPGIGLTGYGSRDGKWFGGEGNISNHDSYYEKYFDKLDSCTVMVTEHQLERIVKRYQELVKEKKDYYITRNDCTSFVMDLADAGGIKYGDRLKVQTPRYFMEQLKAHNNKQYFGY